MFSQTKEASNRGDFFALFRNKIQFVKYVRCIMIGIPLWFVVGVLITLSPEFGKVLRVQGEVSAGAAVAWCYGGIVIGDIAGGLISQWLKSRIKVVYIFLGMATLGITAYFTLYDLTLQHFYWLCGGIGLTVGYWVIFMTIATEQFGTKYQSDSNDNCSEFCTWCCCTTDSSFPIAKRCLWRKYYSFGDYRSNYQPCNCILCTKQDERDLF
ncbi:hypothetical protein [Pedobacter sp. NJ-S-72]